MSEESDHTSFATFAEHHVACLTPLARPFEGFVDRHATLFAGYGVERVKASAVARIVYAMVVDVVDDPVSAELYAVAKIAIVLAESEQQISPTEDYLDRPMERLAPLSIPGCEERQQRWLAALNLIQLRHWHEKGLRDFRGEVAQLEISVALELDVESELLHARGWMG